MLNISKDQYSLPNFVIFYLGPGMIKRIMQVIRSELELPQQQQQKVFPTGSFKPLAGGLVTATLGTSGLQTLKLSEE